MFINYLKFTLFLFNPFLPMSWNCDPDYELLQQKLDRILEIMEKNNHQASSDTSLLTFRECMDRLRCSERTLRYYLFESNKNRLPYLKLGRKILIREDDLSGFIEMLLNEISPKRSLL